MGTLLFDHSLTLTGLATGFTIAGGTISKILTVEDTSLLNQDLTTDASPTFEDIIVNHIAEKTAAHHVVFDNNINVIGTGVHGGESTFFNTVKVQQGYGLAFSFGADVNLQTLTDNTRKFARVGVPHYDTDEEPFGVLVGDSNLGYNKIYFGGGSNQLNAATEFRFYTATDTTTLTGTARMTIIDNGNVGIGTFAPVAKLHIDQFVSDAAIPALILDQADVSEGFINFIGSDRGVITGATDSLESVRVEINGVVRRIAVYVDA